MSHDDCVALPHGAMGLSAVCDCDISGSYSFTIFLIWGLTHRRTIKEETIAINRGWVYSQACRLSYDIQVISNFL